MTVLGYGQIMYVNNYAGLPLAANDGQLAMDMSTMSTYIFNAAGNTWMPLGRVIIKREMNSVNTKNTGTTLIYTLESSSLNFYPFAVIPRAVSVSGVVTGPTISIGSNSPSYNNIATASLLSNVLSTLVGGNSLNASTYSPPLAGGTQIYANVSVGAVATNYTIKYDILGYYDL